MYYLRIPLRYLATPADDKQGQAGHDRKVASIQHNVMKGHLPSWAISYRDVAVIEEGPDLPEQPIPTPETPS